MPKFGTYEVVAKIGLGGFGVVYEGFDPRIGRRVAIKTCSSDREDIRARFLQEARIAGNLDHRNIVVVYDYGEKDEVPYLVQELLGGEDLDKRIAREGKKLPLATKLDWLIQIALGLDYAHRRGIVHRDIKPSNIRVVSEDHVKILDFGIAKLTEGDAGLTRSGETIGTPCYLAPEQIRGGTIDQRCDVYAFGILAYELFSSTRAFPGERPARVLFMVLNDEPQRLESLEPDIPPALADIVRKCHAKKPDDRYASVEEVLNELTAVSRRLHKLSEAATRPVAKVEPAPLPEPAPPRSAGAVPDDGPGPSWRDLPRSAKRRPAWRRMVPAVLLLLLLAAGGALAWSILDPSVAERYPWMGPAVRVASLLLPAPPAEPASSLPSHPPTAKPPTEARDHLGPSGQASPDEPEDRPPNDLARVKLPAAWNPGMTVQLDNQEPMPLDQPRTLDLAVGAHSLLFHLESPTYSTDETLDLELAGGETRKVTVPIAPPAALTVRTWPDMPQLRVSIADGRELGTTPLYQLRLKPGAYRLRLSSTDAADPARKDLPEIELQSGEELVVVSSLREGDETFHSQAFREGS